MISTITRGARIPSVFTKPLSAPAHLSAVWNRQISSQTQRSLVPFKETPKAALVKASSQIDGASLIRNLQAIIEEKFPEHPFSDSIRISSVRQIMAKYFAMSQAFPFIQAGAYANLIQKVLSNQTFVTADMEKTFVVGSFLCWDETGSNYLLRQKGMAALPEILDTKVHFHANLLRNDLIKIFNEPVAPHYCDTTRAYLQELMNKLGSSNKLERTAMMVAFEMHAERMIGSLWDALQVTVRDKKELIYFQAHVGGDDPAEAYHVAMTQRLVQELVSEEEKTAFMKYFTECYALNIHWCREIVKE